MATRLRYWVYGCAVVCMLLAVAYLPPAEYTESGPALIASAETRVLVRIGRALHEARRSLTLLELRDSLVTRIPPGIPEPTELPFLVADRAVPPAITEMLHASLSDIWLDVGPASDVSVVVGVVSDTAAWNGEPERLRWLRYGMSYLLPGITESNLCVAIYNTSDRVLALAAGGELTKSRLPREDLLGVCGFFAAFGMPGPYVERWLEGYRYEIATVLAWTHRSQRVRSRRPWIRYGSPHLLACAGGELDRCRTAVESGIQQSPYSYLYPFSHILAGTPVYWFPPLGPTAGSFLSDLVYEMGKDRFREFWRSELPLDRAFQSAFGVSIEEWTMSWARAQIGERRIGPMVALAGAGSAVLIAGLLVGISLIAARRRVVQ